MRRPYIIMDKIPSSSSGLRSSCRPTPCIDEAFGKPQVKHVASLRFTRLRFSPEKFRRKPLYTGTFAQCSYALLQEAPQDDKGWIIARSLRRGNPGEVF